MGLVQAFGESLQGGGPQIVCQAFERLIRRQGDAEMSLQPLLHQPLPIAGHGAQSGHQAAVQGATTAQKAQEMPDLRLLELLRPAQEIRA